MRGSRRSMRLAGCSGVVAAGLLLTASGCADYQVPLPSGDLGFGPGQGLLLGMPARELLEAREFAYPEPLVGYQEYLGPGSWMLYEFPGTGEETAPDPRAPLVGVRAQRLFRDTADAFRDWRATVLRANASIGVTPTCVRLKQGRTDHIQAEWGDTLRLTLALVMETSDDGRRLRIQRTLRYGTGSPRDGMDSGVAPVVRCDLGGE